MATLLGHLAQFASFSSQGEFLSTQGLKHLLSQHPDAGAAFAAELTVRTGVPLDHNLVWLAEQRQSDGGRSDLEGRIGATPIVKIEAKLDAAFSPDQFRSYVSDLETRLLRIRREGVLVVLVPSARVSEASEVVKQAFNVDGDSPWRAKKDEHPDVVITVLSWDDLLTALERVETQAFRSELEQFQGMYQELRSSYIAPLAAPADIANLAGRADDFRKLVDRATRRLNTQEKLLPLKPKRRRDAAEDLGPAGHVLRYVYGPPGETDLSGGKGSYFSIGVRDPFAGSDTAIWMRFHRVTGGFTAIRARLESSDLAAKLVRSGGHIWIPLDIPLGLDAEQMVNALVAQAHHVRQVAYDSGR